MSKKPYILQEKTANGYGFFFFYNKANVLKLDRGDSCTTP